MARRKDRSKAAADIQRDASRAVRRAARTAEQSGAAKRFRRPRLGFPAIIAIIVILGSALVAFAATNRETAARPRQNEDHWHSPYAVWDCVNGGTADDPIFEPPFQSSRDEEGIHSHQDGVIHIHPFFDRTAGRNAQVRAFMREMGGTITEDAIEMPDGRIFGVEEERTIVDEEGNPVLDEDGNEQTETAPVECDGEPVIIQVARWHRSSQLDRDPVIYTEDLESVRFFADQEAFVFARAPEGADIPPPPEDRVTLGRGLSPQSVIDENLEGTEDYGTEDFDPEAVGEAEEETETEATTTTAEFPDDTEPPAAEETPATTEIPATPETPASTELPATTETPATSETPAATEAPVTTASPATEAPPTTEAPATTASPTIEAPSTTEPPATTETPTTTEG